MHKYTETEHSPLPPLEQNQYVWKPELTMTSHDRIESDPFADPSLHEAQADFRENSTLTVGRNATLTLGTDSLIVLGK